MSAAEDWSNIDADVVGLRNRTGVASRAGFPSWTFFFAVVGPKSEFHVREWHA